MGALPPDPRKTPGGHPQAPASKQHKMLFVPFSFEKGTERKTGGSFDSSPGTPFTDPAGSSNSLKKTQDFTIVHCLGFYFCFKALTHPAERSFRGPGESKPPAVFGYFLPDKKYQPPKCYFEAKIP